MTLAESIPDAISFAESLGDIVLVAAIIGCLFTVMACVCVVGFPVEHPEEAAAELPVTVLKPLHDTEPDIPARLAAFCRQDYGAPVQVLCGALRRDSITATAVHAMMAESSDLPIEIAVEPRTHGVNRKVSNLINMMPRARHDTLVLSDSDIVVGPRYLRTITALLASPRVGAVTCLYYGIGGDRLWTRLAALAVNVHFLPLAITAIRFGLAKPCFGATIALRRSMLERVGGFGALADVLADDNALGVAIQAQGYDVIAAPFLVGHCFFEESPLQLVRQQLRGARTIKSIDPIAYAGTIITHPWPLALLALLLGSHAGALVVVAALLSRVMLGRCIEWRFDLPRQNYWLIPLQDIIAFAIYVASFFGATVHWRGADYRVMSDGTLLEGQDLRGS